MNWEMVLSIIGTLIVLMLGINAHFLKGLYEKITNIGTVVAVAVNEATNQKTRIDSHETRLNNQDSTNNVFREGLHQTRGELGNSISLLALRVERLEQHKP